MRGGSVLFLARKICVYGIFRPVFLDPRDRSSTQHYYIIAESFLVSFVIIHSVAYMKRKRKKKFLWSARWTAFFPTSEEAQALVNRVAHRRKTWRKKEKKDSWSAAWTAPFFPAHQAVPGSRRPKLLQSRLKPSTK